MRPLTTTEKRFERALDKSAKRNAQLSEVKALREKGYSNVAIADRLGMLESTVRTFLTVITKGEEACVFGDFVGTPEAVAAHVKQQHML